MPLSKTCASGLRISIPHSTTIIRFSASPVRAIKILTETSVESNRNVIRIDQEPDVDR